MKHRLSVLARLHAHGNTADPFVIAEHREIIESIAIERQETRHAWHQTLLIPSNFRRVFLGVALQFSVQMTGVSVIQYYSPTIFASIGVCLLF
jgi:hypothetical protein